MHIPIRDCQGVSTARTGARSPRRTGRHALLLALPVALTLIAGCGQDQAGTGQNRAGTSGAAPSSAAPDGNGIDRLSGKEIMDRAVKATSDATSVRFRGRVSEGGEAYSFDIKAAGRTSADALISMKGQRLRVLRIGRSAYVKGDANFWKGVGGQDAVRMFSGKYLRIAADEKDFRDLMSLTFVSKMVGEQLKVPGAMWTKGGRTRVGGRPAITMSDGTPDGKVYVATEGEPHILRLSVNEGTIDFTDYGKPLSVKAPPRGSVISTP